MKVKCKRTLYWHQVPGYSGSLNEKPGIDEINGVLVFKAGEKYKVIVLPYDTTTGLNYINICMIGEDGKAYSVLQDELHYKKTEFVLKHFNFNLKIDIIDGNPAHY